MLGGGRGEPGERRPSSPPAWQQPWRAARQREPSPSSAPGAAHLGEQVGEGTRAAAGLQAMLEVLLLSVSLFKMKHGYEGRAHLTQPRLAAPVPTGSSVSQRLGDPGPINPSMLLAGLHHPHSLPSFPWGQRLGAAQVGPWGSGSPHQAPKGGVAPRPT